jgi:glycosyltransferase involved in cell wall biosynthesis
MPIKKVLYLSYDGVLEPLGESQVLAYLEKLSERGVQYFLISFEKRADWQNRPKRVAMRERMKRANICWYPLRYHKRPLLLSTLFDAASGFALSITLFVRFRFQIVHARSYVMAMLALSLRVLLPIKFIFDMRGFWVDERADSGQCSRESRLYKFLKKLERAFLKHADAVVSLTEAGVTEMKSFSYLALREPLFTVIPTCADLELFVPAINAKAGGFLLGYVGTTTLWYDFPPVVTSFRALKKLKPEARLLILTRDPAEPIRKLFKEFSDSVTIRFTNRDETIKLIQTMDAILFYLHPFYSKRASAPTKLAECLGCGVPVLTNRGVGDMDLIFDQDGIGAIIEDKSSEECIRNGVAELLAVCEDPQIKLRCRQSAEKRFSLTGGVQNYFELYQRILS